MSRPGSAAIRGKVRGGGREYGRALGNDCTVMRKSRKFYKFAVGQR
jgi:hypothetical protein